MDEKDIKLLETNGWTVVCEGPFELEDEEGAYVGTASGSAAHFILETLQLLNEI